MAKFEIRFKNPIQINLGLREFIFEIAPPLKKNQVIISCGNLTISILEKTLGYLDPFTLGEIDGWWE